MNPIAKIERLLEESKISLIPRTNPKLNQELSKIYSDNFYKKYSPADINKILQNKENLVYVIRSRQKVIGVLRLKYLKTKDYPIIQEITQAPKILFMADLISVSPGTGKQLITFATSRAKKEKLEFFTSAWKKELIPYYEKNGFEFIKQSNKKVRMLKFKT